MRNCTAKRRPAPSAPTPIKPEWLGHIAEQVGEGVAVADLKGRLIFANRAWARMHGYTVQELIGKNLRTGHTARQLREEVAPFNRKVMRLGKWTGEVGHVKKDGTEFPTEMTTTLLHDEQSRPVGLIGFAKDVTDRKRAERTQQQLLRVMDMVSRSNHAIARAGDEQRLLQDICDLVVTTGGYRMSWVGFVAPGDPGTVIPVAACGARQGYLQAVRFARNGAHGQGPTGRALRRGRPVVCKDIRTEPGYGPWRKQALKRGYASSAAFPLKYRKRSIGVLNIYADRTGAFDRQEMALLDEMADDLANGIVALRDRRALAAAGRELTRADRQLHAQLRQLTEKQTQLIESEERYRNLVEMSPYGIIVHCQGTVVYANAAAVQLVGARNASQLVGRPAIEFVHPDSRNLALRRIGSILDDRVEVPLQEEKFIRLDGTTLDVEVVASPLVYHDKPSIQVMFRDVSERTRAAQLLAESERKYRELADTLPQTVFDMDSQGRLLYANKTAFEQFGHGAEALEQGINVLDLLVPQDRGRALANIKRRLAGKHSEQQEYTAIRRDGTTFPVNIYAQRVMRNGRVAGLRGVVIDVSMRKKLETSIHESETKFRALAETSPSGIFVYRETFLYVNQACEVLTGYSRKELLALRFWDIVHPDYRELIKQRGLARQRGERMPSHYEFKVVRKDGREHWVDFAATTVQFEGALAGMGTIFDITEKKLAEERLSESELLHRTLIAGMSEALIQVDNDDVIQFVNQQFISMFGYGDAELIGKVSNQMFFAPDQQAVIREKNRLRLQRVADTYQARMRRKDGSELWVQISGSPLVNTRGDVIGSIGVISDITLQKQAESQLRQSEEFNRAIVDKSPIGIAVRDRRGRLLSYNDAWKRIWAMPDDMLRSLAQEMTRDRLRDVYSYIPEHLPEIFKIFEQGGTYLIPEIRIKNPRPGEARWIRQHFYTINDSRGAIDKIVVLVEDISERKAAEQELQKSRLQYQDLSGISPVGIFQTDAEGRTIYVNPRWSEISGVPQASALADDWLHVVHPDDRDKVSAGWRQAVRDRAPSSTEYRFLRPDGSIRWVMGQAVPEKNDDGTIIGYVGTITDITEHKQIEQALFDSEEKYRQIFEGISEGIYRSTPAGKVLMSNPAMVKMLGYDSSEDILKRNIETDGYFSSEVRRRFQELIERDGKVRDFVSTWRTKDGRAIVVSENAHVVRDDRERVLYYEGTVEDITEHLKADLALLDEKNKLSQLFEVSLSVARAESIQQQLDLTVKGLIDLNLFRRIVVIVKDAAGRNAHLAQFGLQPHEVERIRSAPPASEQARAVIFDPRNRISNSYFIPHDAGEAIKLVSAILDTSYVATGDWHPQDNLTVPLVIKGKFIGYISADEPVDGRIPSMETVRLLELYANQAAIAVENLRLYHDLEHSYYDTLKAFVAAMEAKDPYTKGHSENVRQYALKLAQFMGLPADRIRLIDYSSLLHDIGKMGVKEQILSKPSLLSAVEYEEVKQHPAIGSQMVSAIENLSSTAPIIHSHHEYYDGTGYPGGIKGDQIPLESRIISVADAFEAMTSDRPYRKAFGFREALRRLVQASGTQFDVNVVNAFIAMSQQEGEPSAQQ